MRKASNVEKMKGPKKEDVIARISQGSRSNKTS